MKKYLSVLMITALLLLMDIVPFGAYAELNGSNASKHEFFIDFSATDRRFPAEEYGDPDSLRYEVRCVIDDKYYLVRRVSDTLLCVDTDTVLEDIPTSGSSEYYIEPNLRSLYVEAYQASSLGCAFDGSCYGDTLIYENESSEIYSGDIRYNVHWKNHDNNIYGTFKRLDTNGNLIGSAKPTFNQRLSLMRQFIWDVLPEKRKTSIDPDQYLIDDFAAELGMKKEDVACLFNEGDKEIWNPDISELPEGYSYDTGKYYLKKMGEDRPLGYHEFTYDINHYYVLRSAPPYTVFSGSASGSGSASTDAPPYYANDKYEVVRCDGNSFTTVSREAISVFTDRFSTESHFYFFRPESDGYCFGFNSSDEMDYNGSGHSSWGISSVYPLSPPEIKSIVNTDTGLKIKWGAVDGAEKYRVYVKGDGGWKRLYYDTDQTVFEYTEGKSGNAYTFTVRCVTADGKKFMSDYLDGVSARRLDTPVITKFESLAEGNKLIWNAVSGNARYRISVKTRNAWKTLGDTYDTSYIHSSQGEGSIFAQPGVTYTYTVTCVSYSGHVVTSAFNTDGWSFTYTGADGEETPEAITGDVNGDGTVNGADAGLLSRYTSGWKDYESKIKNMAAADINGDGTVNGADSGILARHTSGWKQYAKYFES